MLTRKISSLFLATALAVATGCATEQDQGPDDPGPKPVKPTDPATPPAQPLRAEGAYVLDSAFNLTESLKVPNVGGPMPELVDAFDDATAPFDYLFDKLADKVGSADGSKFRSYLDKIALAATAAMGAKFPEAWGDVTGFGKNVVSVASRFGVRAKLELAGATSAGEVTAKVTVYGLTVRLEGEDNAREILFADAGIDDVVVENVKVTVAADGKVTIGEHTFGVTFGDLADAAIQEILIPELMPALASEPGDRLAPFLSRSIRCTVTTGQSLGALVVEKLGEGFDWAGSLIDSACNITVTYVANYINEKLHENTEGALSFTISGTARLGDENGDRIADKMTAGDWTGTVTIAGTQAPLQTGEQKFLGRRP